MKKTRKALMLLLTLLLCVSSVLAYSLKAKAGGTAHLSYSNLSAGSTIRWYPEGGSTSGFNLTGGGTQKLKICMNTQGNKINIGVRRTATQTDQSFFSGTLNSFNTSELSRVVPNSGYHKPYVTNNNVSVSLNVLNTSYFKYN